MEQRSCSGNAKEQIDSIKCDVHNVSSLEGELRLLSLLAIKRAGTLTLHIKQEAYKKSFQPYFASKAYQTDYCCH